MDAGTIEIGGIIVLSYIYDSFSDNFNLRTLQGLSTLYSSIFFGCPRCPTNTFSDFTNYYGSPDYADSLIDAALNQQSTNLLRGNIDFSTFTVEGVLGESFEKEKKIKQKK